jgi:hypothetical protein
VSLKNNTRRRTAACFKRAPSAPVPLVGAIVFFQFNQALCALREYCINRRKKLNARGTKVAEQA